VEKRDDLTDVFEGMIETARQWSIPYESQAVVNSDKEKYINL
jgi:hypothetical protein